MRGKPGIGPAPLPQGHQQPGVLASRSTLHSTGLMDSGSFFLCCPLSSISPVHHHVQECCKLTLSVFQVALRLHRLGTLHLAEGRTSQALQALEKSCKTLTHNVGDGNPLAGESRYAIIPSRRNAPCSAVTCGLRRDHMKGLRIVLTL